VGEDAGVGAEDDGDARRARGAAGAAEMLDRLADLGLDVGV
jgi:hypothetical protein